MPRDLSGREIQVRFNRAKPDRIIVFYKNERMGEATLLDFLANDRSKPRTATATEDGIKNQNSQN